MFLSNVNGVVVKLKNYLLRLVTEGFLKIIFLPNVYAYAGIYEREVKSTSH